MVKRLRRFSAERLADRPLLAKGLRELLHMRSQVAAIALVVAAGIATYLMAISTYASLADTRASFYREQVFADVFADLVRAPEAMAQRLTEIPGISALETRVVGGGQLKVLGFADPVRCWMVSLPQQGSGKLNRLHLRQGRLPGPSALDEVVIAEAFASAHQLRPGDRLDAVIRGKAQRLHIVGIGISPEFVYQIQAGAAFPDFKRFAVLWMRREALASALELEQSFNQVSLSLTDRVHDQAPVIAELDRLLERFGARGAYPRADQLSHKFLSVEFDQLKALATVFPMVFLGVAAFLLNVVFSRVVASQRETIGVLRAFGVPRRRLIAHYVAMVLGVVAIGVVLGLIGGYWLGARLGELYMDFYRFPSLNQVMPAWAIVSSVAIAAVAALAGALGALRSVAKIEPAAAMRPPAPPNYRASVLESLLGGRRDLLGRMAVRQLLHKPLKTLMTLIGIAMASAILTLGMFQRDALFYMVDRQFALAQRNDLQVVFAEQQHRRVLDELRALPAVARVEGIRYEPVRLQHGSQRKRMSLEGWPADTELKRLLVGGDRMIGLPPSGLVLTAALAERMGLEVGENVHVQRLQGDRRELLLPVVGLVDEPIGSSAYAEADWLDRVLGDGLRVSGAVIALLPGSDAAPLYRELQERPQIIAISQRRAAINNFYETMAESMDMFTRVASVLAGVIAFGVLYNTVRIAYAERERELATLRVLGFQHAEVSALLVVELTLLTVLALPLGIFAGWALTQLMAMGLRSELYRVPAYLSPATLSSSAIVVILAAVAAALAIRHKVAKLEPLAALGSRE